VFLELLLYTLVSSATPVLHELGVCTVNIDVYQSLRTKSIEADAGLFCEGSAAGISRDEENGTLFLDIGHYQVIIPVPSAKWTGWITYHAGDSFAYLYGDYPVPVLVQLRDEI